MPDNIGELTGAALNSLPIEKMIAAPIVAAINGQTYACKEYVNFINDAGLNEDGSVRMVPFITQETLLDEAGNPGETVQKVIQVPLLALVEHPNFCIDSLDVDFEMTISSSESTSKSTEAKGSMSAKVGWGPFSMKLSGSVAAKREQVRKTDTRARYSFALKASKHDTPEGMHRVLEYVLESGARPQVLTADTTTATKPAVKPTTGN